MGFEDRDYYREQQPRGFTMSGPTTVVMWLMIANVAAFVVNMFFSEQFPMNDYCSLHADLFSKPWNAWQLLTYGFLHAQITQSGGIFHILMNMFGLFIFGRVVEHRYGGTEFLLFYLAAIVVSGLVWIGWQSALVLPGLAEGEGAAHLIGASGGVSAVAILFCLTFPQAELRLFGAIPMKAWVLGLLFVGLDLFNAISGKLEHVAWQAHLGGAGFAALYFKSRFRFERLVPKGWFDGSSKGWFQTKPKLKVHSADPDEKYEQLDDEADRILEKINSQGESSLTAKERRTLADYSRRMRQKHQ